MFDSFEFTKVSAAAICALLLIVVPRTIIHESHKSHGEVKDGYALPVATETAAKKDGGGETKAAAAFDPAAVVAMIKTAKPENGAGTFKKCLGCHSAEKGAASKAGPNLWNVVGRKKGTQPDFNGYSEAMKAKGGEWTLTDLAQFVHSPKTFVTGTKMIFPGVPEAADLADLLAYVRTLSDSPVALP